MGLEYLKPVSDAAQAHAMLQPQGALGHYIQIHTSHTGLPDMGDVRLALVGVLENRYDENSLDQLKDVDPVRKQFYELFPGNWSMKVVDLGDIHAGDQVEDTYFALKSLNEYLISRKIIPMYLGGSQDLMYPIYRSFDELYTMVNLVNVDSRFDIGDVDAPISSRSYVGKMITQEPYNLNNYSNIGFQTYFNSQDEIDLLDRMFFDATRLGVVDQDVTLVEPVLRDADMVSVDIGVVKSGDTAFAKAYPNGLSGKHACSIARYAGISDRVKVFGLFEIPRECAFTGAQLMAEMLWYFLEGFNYRAGEYPVEVSEGYLKYIVPIEDEQLVFYKSTSTGRYWVQLPFISREHNKIKQYTLLPCNKRDYEQACNQIYPDRWLKARRKNEI